MRKLAVMASAIVGFALCATQPHAMGGGWTPPSASPYAILEPQTVNPDYAPPAPVTTIGKNEGGRCEGQACERERHRPRHRREHR
jgi:hypothetical protein